MDAAKIGSFYDDPVKRACDTFSLRKAYDLRAFSVDSSLPWRARRRIKFLGQYAVGTLRLARRKLGTHIKAGRNISAATKTGGAL
jgi:hypothetical protein